MKTGTILAAMVTVSLGGFVIWQSRDFPAEVASAPGPGVYPTMLGWVLIVLGALLFVQTILSKKKEEVVVAFSSKQAIFVYKLMGLAIGYCLLLPLTGFLVTSFMFLAVTSYFLGLRNWLMLIVSPAIAVAFIVLIFGYLFHIPLPSQSIL
ncbi:tripartite tricarboxylate transporter TctB family protein [Shouchella clausii]|uniref:tripartite tricarboxylate transporter TctB family protein n=1 Tax=Shouchella clausii TaxID=79880 RepID=UPI0031FC7EC8